MEKLQEQRVFYYFSKLMEIPRPSGHEKEVSDFLIETGKKLNLETYQDENMNVVLKRKASKGYENAPKVIIQGHMDMVASKTEDSKHDFLKDPIIPVIDRKYLTAKDTTLGADNGIAVAMGLALLEDKNYEGPQLELLVTTEEETSMAGAINLADDVLEGDYLLNLDSEEEGILTVGSAGGLTFFVEEKIELEEEKEGYEIKVSGLLGGHSGMDINDNRGNAIKVVSFILENLKSDLRLGEFNSGSLDNVIPSSASFKIYGSNIDELEKAKEKALDEFKNLKGDLKIEINEASGKSYSKDLSDKIINMIEKIPSGINTMMDDNITVESSNNLAFVKEEDGLIKSEISIRSSDNDVLDKLKKKVKTILEDLGINFKIDSLYPGWEYKEDSKLRPLAQKVYKKLEGKEFETIVIHAGLECGALYEKYPNLDIISIGPNIKGAHSPKENVEIESVQRVYEYVKELLKEIK
ncbi:beta-Ala-His dipeptidase [Anaerococcus hydrogenalis]|uniref:Cytosol non-specific dipeptidase n=1 Tax=Anaerococcus hydrogenalis TaxID=33029 RepID=A0A2N6UL10_9FIRM|nr:beta-Ala-His dipeptidase [Anaerococcus hydrogenalis]MDK7694442.1 beta-Ala-His dipeptidase [Anaerococcus hydrogenalis]MDK7696220.1 beta-Ala-His dipeptidase [Anaerococcus hydrogenalis]MDK7707469.1 beta-Ala-His dipeptidase [Anaerococcus hydrogenalis]PMC82484.1 aminoacyl-histidine dipeptidase [Anaerococcus hydrogenalis]